MIKVANLLEEAKVGGPQRRVVFAASKMLDQVSTTIVTSFENSNDFEILCQQAGIPFKKIRITRLTKEIKPLLRYIFFSAFEIFAAARYFRNSDFDIVHVNGSQQFKGVLIAKLGGKKVIWHLTDTWMPKIILKVFSMLSFMADGWIYSSERSKAYYQPLIKSNKKGFLIPAPVDTNFVSKNVTIDEFSFTNDFLETDIIIGTVANINPIKGIELFIKAADQVSTSYSNVKFVILGPVSSNQESYFKELQKLCKSLDLKNISFVGKHADVRPFLKKLDIYVCSSLSESSPLSVWEAMAMELPIISTDVGDVGLYVENYINGFVSKVGDINAMSNNIEYLLKNRELLDIYGKESRRIAVQKLDVRVCADRHIRAYSETLRAP